MSAGQGGGFTVPVLVDTAVVPAPPTPLVAVVVLEAPLPTSPSPWICPFPPQAAAAETLTVITNGRRREVFVLVLVMVADRLRRRSASRWARALRQATSAPRSDLDGKCMKYERSLRLPPRAECATWRSSGSARPVQR